MYHPYKKIRTWQLQEVRVENKCADCNVTESPKFRTTKAGDVLCKKCYKKRATAKEANKKAEHDRQYYQENLQKILERNKRYRLENANAINEQRGRYRQENSDSISEAKKRCYEESKFYYDFRSGLRYYYHKTAILNNKTRNIERTSPDKISLVSREDFEIDDYCLIKPDPFIDPVKVLGTYEAINTTSGHEEELGRWLASITPVKSGHKMLPDKTDLDLVAEEHSLAIEYNGLYWHSDEKVGDRCHLEKYRLAKEIGFRLLQFWEDEYVNTPELVKSIINRHLRLEETLVDSSFTVSKVERPETLIEFDTDYVGVHKNDVLVACLGIGSVEGERAVVDFCESPNYKVNIGSCIELIQNKLNLSHFLECHRFPLDDRLTAAGFHKVKEFDPLWQFAGARERSKEETEERGRKIYDAGWSLWAI